MTFKKLFAGITSIAMVFSVVAPVNFASANAAEDLAAYTWGYDEGLTTMTSFDAFNFENAITREQAAKFLVAGAEALGLEDNIGGQDETCDYADLGSADTSLVTYIAEGCELGLFKAQTNFRPLEVFTRGQAELVVARMLNGYDAVNDYADDNGLGEFEAAHEMLLNDGVVHVNVDLNSAVRRGHLMLMLYRLTDVDPTDPSTPVDSGSVEISRVSSAGTVTVPSDVVNQKVGTIKVTAGSDGARVSSLTVKRSGLTNKDGTPEVYLQGASVQSRVDVVRSNTDEARVRFVPALQLSAGQSINLDLMVSIPGTNNGENNTHTFSIIDANINGTASGMPVSLGTIKTSPALSETVRVDLQSNIDTNLKAGDKSKAIAKLNVDFDRVAGTLDGFILTNSGATDLDEAFANAAAYINGSKVGNVALTKDKVIVTGLNKSVAKDDDVTVEIKADVIFVGASANFTLNLDSASDFFAKDADNGFGLKANTDTGTKVTIAGYDLKFKKVKIERDILPNTKRAVFYEATLSAGADVVLEDFTLILTDPTQVANFTGSVRNAVLEIDGIKFDLDNNGVWKETGEGISIPAGREVTIKVTADVNKASSNPGFSDKFRLTLNRVNDENGDPVTTTAYADGDVVTIAKPEVTVKKLSKTNNSDQIASNSENKEVGRFSVKASKDDITMRDLVLKAKITSGSATYIGDDVANALSKVTLVVGENSYDADIDEDEIKFSGVNYTVNKDKTVNFKLVADFNDVEDYYGGNIELTIIKDDSLFENSNNSEVEMDANEVLEDYAFGVAAPVVALTNHSNTPSFKLNVKNNGDDDMTLTGVSVDVRFSKATAFTVCIATEDLANCNNNSSRIDVATGDQNNTTVNFDFGGFDTQDLGNRDYYVIVEPTFLLSKDDTAKVTLNSVTLVENVDPFTYGNVSATYTQN